MNLAPRSNLASPDADSRRARRLLPAGPILLGAIVLAALWIAGRQANPGPLGFRLDDAWIHQVYARGLLGNGYFAFDDGIPASGCTSPLWAACLAPIHAAAGERVGALVAAVVALGAALQLAAIAAAGTLAHRLTGDRLAGAAAGALLALASPWAAAAFSGMEVTLAGLLLLLGIGAVASSRWRAAGVWLALAALARPESAAVTIVLAALTPWLRDSARSRAALGSLLVPSLIGGAALAAHHLWATGSPLPATFAGKSAASAAALPGRFTAAIRHVLPAVPPLAGGGAWIALGGLAFVRSARPHLLRTALPLIAAVAFLLANLLLIAPIDPAAFYHQRYLLPAVPLLLVALAIGGFGWGARLPKRFAALPIAALLALAAVGAVRTIGPESRHLHNDVRNINEVQRRIGERLRASLPPGTWVAATDAGAVRYFSRLPVLDVLGLNTPQMLQPDESFLRAHPVAAIVLLPAWFRVLDKEKMVPVFGATTEGYTVTSDRTMGAQVVLEALPEAVENGPARVRFEGIRSFAVDLAARPDGPHPASP